MAASRPVSEDLRHYKKNAPHHKKKPKKRIFEDMVSSRSNSPLHPVKPHDDPAKRTWQFSCLNGSHERVYPADGNDFYFSKFQFPSSRNFVGRFQSKK